MRVVWNALCVCIVIPLLFFRKVKEEEEAGMEGEVMVKEEVGGGNTEREGKGRSGSRWGEGMINVSFNHTFCACMLVVYHMPQLPSGII